MDFYTKFHKNVIIPLWDRYKGINYKKYYYEINKLVKSKQNEIEAYQWGKIKSLLQYAYQNVPHYKDVLDNLLLKPDDINTYSDFRNLPILSKSVLREKPDSFLDLNVTKSDLIHSGTGGTTDSPIPIYYSSERNDKKTCEMLYFRKWFKWEPTSKVTYLWGAPRDIPNIHSFKYRIKNALISRNLYLFSSLMNDTVMDEYIDKINRFKPDIIQAYSNPAYLFASYILKKNYKIQSPRSIVVTAEPCYPAHRKIIEDAFGCDVFLFYGARESGYIAVECPEKKNYHINSFGLYVEILKNGKPAAPGEIGDVVITDLHNYAMPFIRYKIGDVASISSEKCECGCELPILNFFAGRETDIFVTRDGDLIPGISLCDRIVTDCEGIEQMQFIQNSYDELIVKIVKGKGFSDSTLELLDTILADYFKNKVKTTKKFVDNIPKDKSGKTRFCISNVLLK